MSLVFPVTEKKNKELREKMERLGILESDLEEKFIKSSGKGGQNVNKTSTGVYLVHRKSGLDVKCTVYRTQGLNRYKARAILCDKVSASHSGVTEEK